MVAKNISVDDGLLTLLQTNGSSRLMLSDLLPFFFNSNRAEYKLNLLNKVRLNIYNGDSIIFTGLSDIYYSGDLEAIGSYLMFHIDKLYSNYFAPLNRKSVYKFEIAELLYFESRVGNISNYIYDYNERGECCKLVVNTSGIKALVSPLFFEKLKLDLSWENGLL